MAPDILSGRKKLEGSFLLSPSLPLISEIENFRSLNWEGEWKKLFSGGGREGVAGMEGGKKENGNADLLLLQLFNKRPLLPSSRPFGAIFSFRREIEKRRKECKAACSAHLVFSRFFV